MDIEVKNITKRYGKKTVLDAVSFGVNAGSCVGVIGANGSGKTTLFTILAGITPGAGAFEVSGTDLMRDAAARTALLGYIPQGTPLIEELTAQDNLLLWYSREELRRSIESGAVRQFGVQEFLHTQVRRMSGGMKKRLSIACSVAHGPAIILMDEPTAALDIPCKQAVADYILQCKATGRAVILATHDERELALCDSIYLLRDGHLAPYTYTGDLADLAEQIR